MKVSIDFSSRNLEKSLSSGALPHKCLLLIFLNILSNYCEKFVFFKTLLKNGKDFMKILQKIENDCRKSAIFHCCFGKFMKPSPAWDSSDTSTPHISPPIVDLGSFTAVYRISSDFANF